MNEIRIEPMTVDCLDDVMEIEQLSFRIPWSRESFIDEITRNCFATYIVAKSGTKAVGYAGMWKVLDEGHITNVAVHPSFRQCGVGSAMMEALIRRADELKIISITLEVRRSNVIAQKLYSNYGFKTEGVRNKYYADNQEDALIMWRHTKAERQE